MENGAKINFHLVYNIVQYYQHKRCKFKYKFVGMRYKI